MDLALTDSQQDELELLLAGVGELMTLPLPAGVTVGDTVRLTDAEGAPQAELAVRATTGGRLNGPVRALARRVARPFEEYYRPVTGGGAVVAALVGGVVDAPAVIRAAIDRAAQLADASVVAVPVPADGEVAAALAVYAPGARVERITAADASGSVIKGGVIFFTGLSGSGKSTIARGLRNLVLEDGRRTVTLLDGDVVRRNLSAGLGFSRADRELNVARIGWVAAEIARHGGLAIASPIAPFASTRARVRAMAEGAGAQFMLVHVSTTLAECERRDRKGLYAKARAGQIADFTGISSPYEVPVDADLVIDTAGMSVGAAVQRVVELLRGRGLLPEDFGGRGAKPDARGGVIGSGETRGGVIRSGETRGGVINPGGNKGAVEQ